MRSFSSSGAADDFEAGHFAATMRRVAAACSQHQARPLDGKISIEYFDEDGLRFSGSIPDLFEHFYAEIRFYGPSVTKTIRAEATLFDECKRILEDWRACYRQKPPPNNNASEHMLELVLQRLLSAITKCQQHFSK